MIARSFVVGLALLGIPVAHAGGLFLPGSGAISTSRAGAAVASADDGEALSINPAGLAKTTGTTITISAAIISYSMEFTRRGTYDPLPDADRAYEGQPFATVKNDPSPPLGIGSFQPVPVVVVVTDLGGRLGKMRLAAGLYAPNAYPFRNMKNSNGEEYIFNNNFEQAPPPSRYDILDQEAAVLLPSIGASYRISDKLDLGARFSLGFADIKSTTTIWGEPGNVIEWVEKDATITIDAKDTLMPAFGLGVTYRPTPNLEFGASYNSQVSIHAVGTARNAKGPQVTLAGQEFRLGPSTAPRCQKGGGGDFDVQNACVDFALPMNATLGGRYKMVDAAGKLRADIELNVGWENWSAERVKDYLVVVDADIYSDPDGDGEFESTLGLKNNVVRHNYNDVFTARLGGSYHIPQGANEVIIRGGIGHDTKAAKTGWLRADVDGAARTTFALGAAFRAKRFQIDVGGGFVFEGSPENPGDCNLLAANPPGCNMDGNERPVDDRTGLDPIDPIVNPDQQIESPVTQGSYKSHYKLIMLGFSTWF